MSALAYRETITIPRPITFRLMLRRARRQKPQAEPAGSLYQVALLQVLLALLASMSLFGNSVHPSLPETELQLPASTLKTAPREVGVGIFITKNQIILGDQPVFALPGREQLISEGLPGYSVRLETHRRSPLNEAFKAVIAQHMPINCTKCCRPLEGDPCGQSGFELDGLLLADRETPYRLLYEVLSVAQQERVKIRMLVEQEP